MAVNTETDPITPDPVPRSRLGSIFFAPNAKRSASPENKDLEEEEEEEEEEEGSLEGESNSDSDSDSSSSADVKIVPKNLLWLQFAYLLKIKKTSLSLNDNNSDYSHHYTIDSEIDRLGGAVECKSNNRKRGYCTAASSFRIEVSTTKDGPSFLVHHPLKKCKRCIPSCCSVMECRQHEIDVYSPKGEYYGKCKKLFSLLRPKYNISNQFGDIIYQMTGQYAPCLCLIKCRKRSFEIRDGNDIVVGRIFKKSSTCRNEFCCRSNFFNVEFLDYDMDVKMKAVFLGMTFLVNFLHFDCCSMKENMRLRRLDREARTKSAATNSKVLDRQ